MEKGEDPISHVPTKVSNINRIENCMCVITEFNLIVFGKCDFPKGLGLCYDTLFAKRGDLLVNTILLTLSNLRE